MVKKLKGFRIIFRIIISILILLLSSIVIIYLDNKNNKSLEDYNYYFEVEIDPSRRDLLSNPQLQDFQIYYDFDEDMGSINFYIAGTNQVGNLILRIPNELELKDISWNSKYYIDNQDYLEYTEKIDYKIEIGDFSVWRDYNYSNIILTRLNDNFEDRTFVNISLEGRLYPNAQFEFMPVGKIQVRKGEERGTLFKFNLGNRYSCTDEPCYELRNEELQLIKGDNKIGIAIKQTSTNWHEGVGHTRFSLYYNKRESRLLSYLREIFSDIISALVGIIIVAIVAIVGIIIEIIIEKIIRKITIPKFVIFYNSNC